jgi:hypothetical protein
MLPRGNRCSLMFHRRNWYQEGQSASTDRNHQVGRPLPIFVPKKIPLPLLLLARKTSNIEELTVKLDAGFGVNREERGHIIEHQCLVVVSTHNLPATERLYP